MTLFEMVQKTIGCEMLSDIKFDPHKKKVAHTVYNMKLSDFPLANYEELVSYVYGETVKFAGDYPKFCVKSIQDLQDDI